MTDPRAPIYALLRPHLKDGWNPPGLIAAMEAALDAAGAARAAVAVAPRPEVSAKGMNWVQQQIDLDLLDLAFPANSREALAEWVMPTQQAAHRWGIDTIRELASFLANINVESAGLTRLEESLNYSVEALIQKFGRHRISVADAQKYGRSAAHPADQKALANILYGGEWGAKNLGNTEDGDGWLCKGYGPKQITGRANQAAFAKAMGIPFAEVRDYVRTPLGGMMSAGWFWASHGLDKQAATPGVTDDRVAINGGTFGLPEVEAGFDRLVVELLRREDLAKAAGVVTA